MPPEEFVEAAESSGLIIGLGESMLRQSCAAALGWVEPLRVAVNVSAVELHRDGYAENVLRILAETGLPPGRLEVEVTETQWVNDAVVSTAALTTLADAGVGVLLDDFGTGYSSFRHLADMPVSGVKIDRSFMAGVTTDERNAAVVRAILCMAPSWAWPAPPRVSRPRSSSSSSASTVARSPRGSWSAGRARNHPGARCRRGELPLPPSLPPTGYASDSAVMNHAPGSASSSASCGPMDPFA